MRGRDTAREAGALLSPFGRSRRWGLTFAHISNRGRLPQEARV